MSHRRSFPEGRAGKGLYGLLRERPDMSDPYFRYQDVEEIKRHIDRSFVEFERRMERKAENERFKTSMRRNTFHFTWMAFVIVVFSVYNNWDFWTSLFAVSRG
jgi:hypothetical protein